MQTITLKQQILPHITDIIAALKNAGYEALIVGGAVRDHLLGRRPKDYDIATTATPEEVRRVFKRKIHTMIIGRRFRLVHLIRSPEDIIEVSTFRRKPLHPLPGNSRFPSSAGAVPENMIFQDNEFGSPEEDAWRRDFTVNALFYDPVDDRIYDYTGMGLADLENRIVRVIGEPAVRFEEDPVRILRALKLIGQYDFKFEPETEKALRASMHLIELASESRLNLELEKIMKSPFGDVAMEAFHQYGFLKYFMSHFEERWSELAESRKSWALRNERLHNGLYRDSISTLTAVLVYPTLKLRPHYTRDDIMNAVDRAAGHLFHPRIIMHRIVEAAGRAIWLQEKFADHSPENVRVFPQMRGYAQAREAAVIRELLHSSESAVEKFWPSGSLEKKNDKRRKTNRGKGRK